MTLGGVFFYMSGGYVDSLGLVHEPKFINFLFCVYAALLETGITFFR
jgi:hypothetical protein